MSNTSHHHGLVRLGMDLGLAVSDYNSKDTEVFDEIIKLSLAYVSKVKQAVMEGQIREDDIADYFALLGASWASIQPRVQNEYSVTAAHPPMADVHTVVAKAAAAAAAAAAALVEAKAAKAVDAKAAKAVDAKAAPVVVAPVAEAKSVSFSDVVKAPAVPTPAKAATPAPTLAKAAANVAAMAKVTDAFNKAASK
jgi:hypothetical protein